jgi:hypothetical protein
MTKKTQCEMVLDMLQKGPVTPLDIFKKTGCLTACERIRDLREKGYNIVTKMIDLPSGKRVGKYFLLKGKRNGV